MNLIDLPEALVRAYAESGQRARAVMPPGRSDEVRQTLTRAVVDPRFRDKFVGALERAFVACGVDSALLDLEDLPISDERLITDGFDGMTEQQLAAIAIDPCRLQAVAEVVLEDANFRFAHLTRGDWFQQACEQWSRIPPWLADKLAAN